MVVTLSIKADMITVTMHNVEINGQIFPLLSWGILSVMDKWQCGVITDGLKGVRNTPDRPRYLL